MSAKLKIKRGTTAGWANPDKDTTLEPGQLGVEYLTSGLSRLKVGTDDANHTAKDWSELDYITANPAMYKDTLIHFSNGMELKPLASTGNYSDKVISAGNIQIGQYEIFPTITTATLGYMKHPFSKLYLGKDPESATSGIEAEIIYSGQTIGGTNKQISLMSVKANGVASLPYLTIGSIGSSTSCTFYTDILGYQGVRVATGGSGSDYLYLSQSGIRSTYSDATLGNTGAAWSKTYTKSLLGDGSLQLYNEYGGSAYLFLREEAVSANSNVKVATMGTTLSSSNGDVWLFDFALNQTMPKATLQSTGIYTVADGCYFYPVFDKSDDITLASTPGCFLGKPDYPWDGAYIDTLYSPSNRASIIIGSNSINLGNNNTYLYINATSNTVFKSTDVRPSTNSTSSTTGSNLGTSSYKWRTVYAYTGSIQTSDRSAKSSIHYLETDSSTKSSAPAMSLDTSTKKVASMNSLDKASANIMMDDTTITEDTTSNSSTGITMDDVIEFVKELQPATFCYLDGNEVATEENSDPEMIQLGLIADDMVDSKLFKYVGVETEGEEVIEPEEMDEETGEIIKEAVTQTKTVRGLQPIPLATAALTACKYLLNEIESLKQEIELIKQS